MAVLHGVVVVLKVVMYACFGFGISYYSILLLWGSLSLRLLGSRRACVRPGPLSRDRTGGGLPGVTMLVPAYNEEVVIVDAVRALFEQDYPDIEVVVVSDGSKDRTVQVLVEAFEMTRMGGPVVDGPISSKPVRAVYRSRQEPRLVLVDKDPAGNKADGSNCAINFATKPWCAVMDADELVDRRAVLRCITQAVNTPGNVVAVGATLLPTNDCAVEDWQVTEPIVSKNFWVGMQTIEYLGAFLVSRPGMSRIGAMPIVSGGFGLFRRDALMRVGGYAHGSLGEDLDMAVRLHRCYLEEGEPYAVIQVPEAIVWTEFPSSHEVLRRQRLRWHRGLRQVINDHRSTVGRPGYGTFGMLGMVQMVVYEYLAVLVEAFGYVLTALLLAFRVAEPVPVLRMLAVTQLLGFCLTLFSVWTCTRSINVYRGARNVARLVAYAFAMQFGYRQMTVWWRIRSLFKSKNTGWGAMPRAGFGTATQRAAAQGR